MNGVINMPKYNGIEFSNYQMEQINKGLENNLDVSVYAKV